MSKQHKRFMTVADLEKEDLENWEWPDYSKTSSEPRNTALNYDPYWEKKNKETIETDQEKKEEVKPLTVEELALMSKQAYEEGFAEGKKEGLKVGKDEGFPIGKKEGKEQGEAQGYTEGFASGQAKIDHQVQNLEQIFEKLTLPLEKIDKNIEAKLVSMVLSLTEQVIKIEAKTNDNVLLSIINQAVNSLPEADGQVQILLNQEDLEVVKKFYNSEQLKEKKWSLLLDQTLPQANVKVKSNYSKVEYSIQNKIIELTKNFNLVNRDILPEIKE